MPPKPKAATSPRRAARAGVRQGATAKPKAPQNRRSPSQLLDDLKAERDEVAQKMGARLAKLDEKIARVEARYARHIALTELAEISPEDLEEKLEAAKRQQRLLKLALKAKK
jgi:hypothetical protein